MPPSGWHRLSCKTEAADNCEIFANGGQPEPVVPMKGEGGNTELVAALNASQPANQAR